MRIFPIVPREQRSVKIDFEEKYIVNWQNGTVSICDMEFERLRNHGASSVPLEILF